MGSNPTLSAMRSRAAAALAAGWGAAPFHCGLWGDAGGGRIRPPMISRLPRWVWFGSAILALIAGAINAIGFLGFQHQGLTHLTGSTTLLGIAVARHAGGEMLHFCTVIGFFFGGCVFSGFLLRDSALKLGRRYGVALAFESALLFGATLLLRRSHGLGLDLASCACGLQNGMVSTYSGAVLRTTHVSGIFTDLGIFLGQTLRGVAVDGRRVRLYLLLLGAFFSGAVLGTWGYMHLGYATLYIPASLTGFVGLAYGAYGHVRRAEPELGAAAKQYGR